MLDSLLVPNVFDKIAEEINKTKWEYCISKCK